MNGHYGYLQLVLTPSLVPFIMLAVLFVLLHAVNGPCLACREGQQWRPVVGVVLSDSARGPEGRAPEALQPTGPGHFRGGTAGIPLWPF